MSKHTFATVLGVMAGLLVSAPAWSATPITGPTTIQQSGSYRLTQDIVSLGCNHVIRVEADNVTIDLDGYAIRCAASGGGAGALIYNPGFTGLWVRNGILDSGFWGIYNESRDVAMTLRFEDLLILDAADTGIFVNADSQGANIRITDNQFSGGGTAIVVDEATTLLVRGNQIDRVATGVSISHTTGSVLRDNSINVVQDGIDLQDSPGALVADNAMADILSVGLHMTDGFADVHHNLFHIADSASGTAMAAIGNQAEFVAWDWNVAFAPLVALHLRGTAHSNNRNYYPGGSKLIAFDPFDPHANDGGGNLEN